MSHLLRPAARSAGRVLGAGSPRRPAASGASSGGGRPWRGGKRVHGGGRPGTAWRRTGPRACYHRRWPAYARRATADRPMTTLAQPPVSRRAGKGTLSVSTYAACPAYVEGTGVRNDGMGPERRDGSSNERTACSLRDASGKGGWRGPRPGRNVTGHLVGSTRLPGRSWDHWSPPSPISPMTYHSGTDLGAV